MTTMTTMAMAMLGVLMMLTMVSALTCPRVYECSAIGGSCTSDTTTVRRCNAGLSTNSVFNVSTGTSTCTCYQYVAPTTTPAPTYTLGQTCTSGTWLGHECVADPVNGIPEKHWFSQKRIGDVCSSTDFDCYPPRKCVNGKCQGNLALGATCYNTSYSFASDAYGICVHNAYCELHSQTTGASLSVGTCIPRRAAGESCYLYSSGNRLPCADGLECVNNYGASSMSVCGREMLYYLDGGAASNSSTHCKSGLLNITDGSRTCLGYDHLLSLVNAKKGQECDVTANCGNSPDTITLSTCGCDGMGTSNTARCSAYSRSTPTELAATFAASVTEATNLYKAGCETSSEHFSYPVGGQASTNWCYRFETSSSSDEDSGYCSLALAKLAAGVKDCDGEIMQYCGALHTLTTSMGVLLALMLAALLGAN